jgi:SCP-2 sterol transfer family
LHSCARGNQQLVCALQAFLFRKLKIKGSMAMAMKVTPVLQAARAPPPKL